MSEHQPLGGARAWIAHGYTFVEDLVYLGLGILLAGIVIALLGQSFVSYARTLTGGALTTGVVELLDRILLTLLIVELLYTVKLSFRAHSLVAEPFLLVGLISAIRRVLVLTAELGQWREKGESVPASYVLELAVLAFLIMALAVSFMLLRKNGPAPAVDRK